MKKLSVKMQAFRMQPQVTNLNDSATQLNGMFVYLIVLSTKVTNFFEHFSVEYVTKKKFTHSIIWRK